MNRGQAHPQRKELKAMENMEIYNKVREVPIEAQKEIKGGRLQGMTDINPMWRIQALTETFGPCGIGWGYVIDRQWIEEGSDGERTAFCNIGLWYKLNGEKSELIPGTGGSMLVENEKKGPHTSDECYKMALTDAISVACKSLGVGANIYWAGGRTKYTAKTEEPKRPTKQDEEKNKALKSCIEKTAKMIGESPDKLFFMLKAKFGTDGQLPTDAIDNCINYLVQLQTVHAKTTKETQNEQVADGTNG